MVNWFIKTVDPLLSCQREANISSSLVLKLFVEVMGLVDQLDKNHPCLTQTVKLCSGNINDGWEPSICQLMMGQDLHSLSYLHHTLTNATKTVTEIEGQPVAENEQENINQGYLRDYSLVQLSEVKMWFQNSLGDVVLFFPATIQFTMSDLYHGACGHTESETGFAQYVSSSATRLYEEFRNWKKAQENFTIQSLKVYSHSRGAAVADLFLFLGEKDMFKSVNDKTIVRGSPLPSLGRANEFLFRSLNVVNVLLVGNENRDPFSKIKKGFYHPSGHNIFLKIEC